MQIRKCMRKLINIKNVFNISWNGNLLTNFVFKSFGIQSKIQDIKERNSCYYEIIPEPAITCSKLTIETLEQGVKLVHKFSTAQELKKLWTRNPQGLLLMLKLSFTCCMIWMTLFLNLEVTTPSTSSKNNDWKK